ncbi:hypothetical protein KBC75_05905 [Candidatus Shapirobacteria bacterium]|nr:hypothetical protein [Candidatus Shapirobacteria bacterium]
MKKISLIILSIILLSACSLKNPLDTSPKASAPTQQEVTTTSDQETLQDFSADIDSDFSAEFSSLEKDLE